MQAYCEDGTVCNGVCISPDYDGDCVKGIVTLTNCKVFFPSKLDEFIYYFSDV